MSEFGKKFPHQGQRVPAFFLFLVCSLSVLASEPNADEKAVWELEERYWVYVKGADVEGYLTLWDEGFVGWPSFSDSPLGKETISDWIAPLHADTRQRYDYELKPMAVRSFGEVVVVHYLVTQKWFSAQTGVLTRSEKARITHTWKRKGDGWVIIGGMSSRPATP